MFTMCHLLQGFWQQYKKSVVRSVVRYILKPYWLTGVCESVVAAKTLRTFAALPQTFYILGKVTAKNLSFFWDG